MITNAKRHGDAVRLSGMLTASFRRMYQKGAAMIGPEDVIRVLNRAKVDFVLMGTHGVGGWRSQPRATQDVDALIRPPHHQKAVDAVGEAFPNLRMEEALVVTRFLDPLTNQPVVDLMKPSDLMLEAVFRHSIWIEDSHRIPDLEMALVTKFAAMISTNRAGDKRQIDGGDFENIVTRNLTAIDQRKLATHAELIYEGAGADILKCVDDIRAGEMLDFKALVGRGELLP